MPVNLQFQPKTLDEAVNHILKSLDDGEAEFIKTEGKTDDDPLGTFYSIAMHHGLGQAIRNNWGLWGGSELKTFFEQTYGLGHADDMSGLILGSVEAAIRNESFVVEKEAKRYKEFWRKQKIDPLTQKEI
jgi:hypothetical protein